MTPTEQDKELLENSFGEWLENHGVELIGNNPSHLGTWQAMVDMNELKQAITSLTKELVAEAKPSRRLPDDSPTADEDLVNYGYNEAINQFEHNLLKALEEV